LTQAHFEKSGLGQAIPVGKIGTATPNRRVDGYGSSLGLHFGTQSAAWDEPEAIAGAHRAKKGPEVQ